MSTARMSITGFLSQDPTIQYTQAGKAVLNLSVPHTPRRFNKDTNEWEDAGTTLWVQTSVWEEQAELLAGLLSKGTPVRLEGEPTLRAWESNGKSGVNLELKFAEVAIIPRPQRSQQAAGVNQNPGTGSWGTGAGNSPQTSAEGWATTPPDDSAPF